MKTIKKIIYTILLINIISSGYLIYKKGYKFDADDPDKSIQIMLNITDPLERKEFLQKFQIACNDVRCLNLHGLTKEEIYSIADKKIKNSRK